MKKLTTLLMVGLCTGALPDGAWATPESRSAPLLLLIDPGSRAIAMGESYVAVADDATASYFNPAALVGQTRKSSTFRTPSGCRSWPTTCLTSFWPIPSP